jgi:hypothetical protein
VVPVAVPLPPRLFVHVTWVTPTLSAAVPPSIRVERLVEKVAPEVGEVMDTVGAVVSFATVTVTAAEAVMLPAASRATAVRVWDPFDAVAVFQEALYGAVVSSAPRLAPSSLN